jgi:hypothetical protein
LNEEEFLFDFPLRSTTLLSTIGLSNYSKNIKMKKRSQLLLTVSMLIMLFGCNQNNEHFLFEQSYDLEGIENQSQFLYKGGQLHIYDTLLIVTSTPQTTQCIHFFNKRNLNYITSVGNVGKGDREISRPGIPVINPEKGILWYPDIANKKILKFDIEKIINKKERFPESTFIPTPFNPFFGQYSCVNDRLFSFRHSSPDTLISFFSKEGAMVRSLAIPDNTNIYDYHKMDRKIFNSSALYVYTSSPDLNKIAIAYRFSDTFQILDKKGNIEKTLKGPDKIHQIPELGNLEQKITYKQIQSDENYIYCLYSGEPLIKRNGTTFIPSFAQKLRIFDWKGNAVAGILFDKKVVSFVIDQTNKNIITFCPETGNLIKYPLPNIL